MKQLFYTSGPGRFLNLTFVMAELISKKVSYFSVISFFKRMGILLEAFFKKQDQTLIESDCFQTIIDAMQGSVVVINGGGEILSVNLSSLKLWGYKSQQLIGKKVYSLLETEASGSELSFFLASDKKKNVQLVAVNAAGNLFQVEIEKQSLSLHNESYILLNITDISERVKMEADLASKSEEIEMLLYKSSHNLRGPLTSIMGLVSVMKTLNLNEEEMAKYLDYIELSAEKLDNELKMMTLFNKISSDPLKYDFCCVQDVCREVIEEMADVIEDNPICFQIEPEEKVYAYTDSGLLRFSLYHLIDNAIKFRKNHENVLIKIELSKDKDALTFSISDNGQGIPDAVKPRIFEMFYRGNPASDGSGLGLYLVQKGIGRLNGNIEVESKAGEGSRFIVSIPVNTDKKNTSSDTMKV